MKMLRSLFSILSLLSLGWFLVLGYFEYADQLVSVDRSLTMLFAFIVLIAFLSVRISLIDANHLNKIVLVLAVVLIALGLVQWLNPPLMTSIGSYSIVVGILLLGISINSQLRGKGKMTVVVKGLLLTTILFFVTISLLSPDSKLLFDIAFVLLLLSSIGVIASIFFQKRIS